MLIALVLALTLAGGTAYAAPKTAKQIRKIAAKVVARKAPTLSVAHAETAATAANATEADHLVGYRIVEDVSLLGGGGTVVSAIEIRCPTGTRAVGGGAVLSSNNAVISESAPTADGQAWLVSVRRILGTNNIDITSRAVCLPV